MGLEGDGIERECELHARTSGRGNRSARSEHVRMARVDAIAYVVALRTYGYFVLGRESPQLSRIYVGIKLDVDGLKYVHSRNTRSEGWKCLSHLRFTTQIYGQCDLFILR